MAMPSFCAAAARLRLTLRARSKPPVIDEIKIGALSFLPRNVVADIDLVEIQFRQSVVNETIAVESGAGMAR